MDAIINFLETIGNAISSVISFVISFFQDVIYMIQITGKVLAQLPSYLSWMPPQMSALLLILLAVVVVYKILGREG